MKKKDVNVINRNWLIQLRQNKGYTLTDVAKNIGVSRTYYFLIERGERTPSGLTGVKIADLLGFEMRKFYENDNSIQNESKMGGSIHDK